jgi:DNA-binding transcriptional ArsR family regulator
MMSPEAGLLALADKNRLHLLRLLLEGPRTVSDLAHVCGLGQSLVSHHLAVLTRSGWLASRREGRRRLYRVESTDSARQGLALWLRRHVTLPPAWRDEQAAGSAAPAPVSGGDLEDYLL